MQSLLIEFVLRSSLIAAAVALAIGLLRIKSAAARHKLWASMVVLMALLPGFLAWGPKAPIPVLPRIRGQAVSVSAPVVESVAERQDDVPNLPVLAPRSLAWNWLLFFESAYVLCSAAFLLRLAIGTMQVHRLLRTSLARGGHRTHASCATPVTVGWLRPSVILPESWPHWSTAKLAAVLAHEQEHARRRDPLVQWIALLNRALFWFHPLAWWLERQLSGLAEEACDAAVLDQGHDPHVYSECLLDLARSLEKAGTRIAALGVAMPGAFLPQRIRRMLSGKAMPRPTRKQIVAAIAVCASATVIFGTGTLVRAQSTDVNPKFEVSSVKPSKPGESDGGGRGKAKAGGRAGIPDSLEHGRLTYSNTVFGFIVKAYGINGCGLLGEKSDCPMIAGGPAWIRNDRFEIQAEAPEGTPDYTFFQFLEERSPQIQLMLQSLLTDRFALKIHREQKEIPVYILTTTKRSPNLKPGTGKTITRKDGTTVKDNSLLFTVARKPNGEFDPYTREMIVRNRPMSEFAYMLTNVLDRLVLDRTGLTGEFDMDMLWDREVEDVPDPDQYPPNPGTMFSPSFFSALQEKLGLKLEPTKVELPVLVIDHVEEPTPN